MNTSKKPKAVEAWALVDRQWNAIYALWTFDRREAVVRPGSGLNQWRVTKFERWIRVRIVPIAVRRKARKTP